MSVAAIAIDNFLDTNKWNTIQAGISGYLNAPLYSENRTSLHTDINSWIKDKLSSLGLWNNLWEDEIKLFSSINVLPKNVNVDELAQALRSIGEPIFGQSVKDISGGRLLKQLFDITEKFNMPTQPQLLLLQKTMVVVEGVARKLNPETNIWETSRPVLEKWLRETKDPINNFTETLKDSAEVLKKLPELPQMMEKANQALTFLASGQIPQNTNSYSAMKNKELEMKSFRNQSIIGLLLLVFIGFMVF